jgi:hypothetical protein
MKEHKFKLIYMEPPIKPYPDKLGDIHEFKSTDFDSAYDYAKEYIKDKKKGTIILMLAQMTR